MKYTLFLENESMVWDEVLIPSGEARAQNDRSLPRWRFFVKRGRRHVLQVGYRVW